MWLLFLFPLAWPFLALYAMIRFPRTTITLMAAGVTWYLFEHTTGGGWVAIVVFAAILIAVLRIREQDDNAREAINLQRVVERDLDQRDRYLEAGRADRARMELQADLIAKALVREAGKVRR